METTQEHASLVARDGSVVMFEGMRAEGDIKGLLLDMTVEQRFRNPTDRNIEVVYTFPLPWGAVLLGVDVTLGGKKLTGSVIEKKRAESRYEEALSEGDTAIMLEKNRDHSYSLNLGNLAAKEACVVTLRYAQLLQFEQRGLRLLLPTVIAPRYGDPIQDGGLAPHQVAGHDLLAEYPFDLTLRLHGDLAKARVSSPSHPIGLANAAGMLTVTLGRQAMLDRDFVLVLDQIKQDSILVIAKDSVNPERFVALASFCPRVPNNASAALALKILVDCSSSMAGDSIAAARRALQSIVQQFGSEDRFSLSRFGNNVQHRSRGMWRTTEKTRISAQRWVGSLDADMGGTEMGRALEETFKLGDASDADVLLVTDGEIEAIDQTIESAKTSGHRVFIVGIGSSPSEGYLRRLAEASGGACDFVAPGEAVAPAVLRMFARLRSPRLSDVHVAWGDEPLWTTPAPKSVFDGDTVNVFAMLDRAPDTPIRLMGKRIANGKTEEIGVLAPNVIVDEGDAMARTAAATRIQSGDAEEATALAVDYQLVTPRTNFLLVHARAEEGKANDMPELRKVAPMMPAGWGGTSSGMFSIDRGKPAMWRRASADGVDQSYSLDSYDVPRFLRRGNDVPYSTSSKHWVSDEEYLGLSPFGVCETLRKIDPLSWPKTYQDLRQIGVGDPVIDWLEAVMEGDAGAMVTVRTFVFLMSNDDTYQKLMKQLGILRGVMAASHKILTSMSRDKGIPVGIDHDLLERMMQSLAGMTASAWPQEVLWPDGAATDQAYAVDALTF